jgi:hypothetical protein
MYERYIDAITAPGPHPSLGKHADVYGRLVGSWIGEIRNHTVTGPPKPESIEIHFAWGLDGRAIQDTWITPARHDRASKRTRGSLDWYGTTLRLFDAESETWKALWWDPISRYKIELEGHREGDDIVQVGTRGVWPIRWTFSEIMKESFHW